MHVVKNTAVNKLHFKENWEEIALLHEPYKQGSFKMILLTLF